MSDLREALDHILRLCNESRTYTRRTQAIHEVAMQGLGLTANQRQERHMAILGRTGGNPAQEAYLARKEKRQAKLDAKLAARDAAESAEAP